MGLIYEIGFTSYAFEDLERWKKSGQKTGIAKIQRFLQELCEHPYTGTGKVEALKFDLTGKYSRRIDDKHRLVYSVDEEQKRVVVHSLWGHY